ncbi:MAG: hypothetical protein D8M57_17970 [Candidatus Scalindua sp. AMX11]|nr:MAG: hypothetical protein DWQ00_06370 [Candidatus Scalindua sp.]NOG83393.1 hypothetical protein [Planctomycetota bacterium]RZV75093.1 MAG: hypothetical protein EX341_12880 [Candidatus Scalindua sp. SCAELEC01]TDE63491.1 MAG: hypothetical protein D8M57_17970 [Candidatus Scalindua sp. AMX11]GJQ57280.1 MAG: hypothetical protein SCALA701_00810 [Candidatus Scalindua sp.]
MKKISVKIMFVILLVTCVGCGYGPPMKVTLSNLADTPSLYRNKNVEISGYVIGNEYSVDKYVTWQLLLEESGMRIYCYKNGYNRDVIAICANLAEEAMKNNEKITVTGRLREGGYSDKDIISDTKLELKTFEYKEYKIDTDYEGDKWLHPAHDTYDIHGFGH